MARQVSTIAVLLIVQGVVDVMMGLALAALGFYVATGRTPMTVDAVPVEPRVAVLVFGPLFLAAGVLKIVAGLRNYGFRSPRLGLLALASGVVSAASCACAPFSLALMVYGLILYRRPESERAFVMGRQGLSREWILASLSHSRRQGL